jgi:hypothetical protein
MIIGSLILIAFLVLSVLSLAFGEDSREATTDPRRNIWIHGMR